MSDVKLSGVGQPIDRVVSISSSQKSQDDVTRINSTNAVKNTDQNVKVSSVNGNVQNVSETQKDVEQIVKSQEQVANAVTKLNDYVQSVQRNLQFNLDDTSGKTIITVVDKDTSKVIRQIPDDVALKLAQDLQQSEPLSLFNAKV